MRAVRQSNCICEACNVTVIVGHAFTRYECKECEETFYYPNTDVPKLCSDCALKENKCCYCERDLRNGM